MPKIRRFFGVVPELCLTAFLWIQVVGGQGTLCSETEVLVVGAGVAGLSAANHFRVRGIDYQVVEALNREGGRVSSIFPGESGNSLDATLEECASWLYKFTSGEGSNPILNLANKYNIEYVEDDFFADVEAFSYDSTVSLVVPLKDTSPNERLMINHLFSPSLFTLCVRRPEKVKQRM